MGYWIAESGRGKGAAKTTLKEAAVWLQNNLKVPRIELYIEPWNRASIKTAEAAGFQQEGLMRSWQSIRGVRKDMIMMSQIATLK